MIGSKHETTTHLRGNFARIGSTVSIARTVVSDRRSSRPRVNLVLQGGGSHGAFTWGVLDTLLEDGRVTLEGISGTSGTSAGAMDAVALAFHTLRDLGVTCAGQWLASNFKQLGVASSLNIARDYLDDLRVPSR